MPRTFTHALERLTEELLAWAWPVTEEAELWVAVIVRAAQDLIGHNSRMKWRDLHDARRFLDAQDSRLRAICHALHLDPAWVVATVADEIEPLMSRARRARFGWGRVTRRAA